MEKGRLSARWVQPMRGGAPGKVPLPTALRILRACKQGEPCQTVTMQGDPGRRERRRHSHIYRPWHRRPPRGQTLRARNAELHRPPREVAERGGQKGRRAPWCGLHSLYHRIGILSRVGSRTGENLSLPLKNLHLPVATHRKICYNKLF